jgi:8-oxo-dGTP pyrophosphatase MutT (NUDIX family)
VTRPAHRRVSRIILLDQDDRFLLFLTASPKLAVPTVRWITPGGGVDEGESHTEGAIRELFEETGLQVSDVGEPVHTISGFSTFNDGHVQTTYVEFFVVRTGAFDITRDNWLDYEHSDILDVRWWSLEELVNTQEPIGPADLAEVISRVLST